MPRAKRVYVSVPRDHHLDDRQRGLKHAIFAKLRGKGLEPQEFHVSGLPLRAPYTFDAVREIMARCHGALTWPSQDGGTRPEPLVSPCRRSGITSDERHRRAADLRSRSASKGSTPISSRYNTTPSE